MTIVLISLGVLIVLFCMGSTFLLFRKLKKIKKSRSVQFSKLIESDGDYGLREMSNPTSEYTSDKFIVEFKVIGKAKNEQSDSTYLNIRVLNVSVINIKDSGTKIDEGKQLLYGKQWMRNYNDIYWFTDNEARRRDVILTDLLKDGTSI